MPACRLQSVYVRSGMIPEYQPIGANLLYCSPLTPSLLASAVEYGHGFTWFFMRIGHLHEPLWGTERFEALMQRIEAGLVEQRQRAAVITQELGL